MESVSDLKHSPELTEASGPLKVAEPGVEDKPSIFKEPRTTLKEVNPFRAKELQKFGETATKLAGRTTRDPTKMWRRVFGFRVPSISPERLRANWEPTCFIDDVSSDEEAENGAPKSKDEKEKSAPVKTQGDGSETSSTDTSTSSTSSSETSDEATSESEPECMDHVVHVEGTIPPRVRCSNNYLLSGAKTGRVEAKKARKIEKSQPAPVPLFTKPLELQDAQLKYLEAKCDGTDEKELIKPSRKEQQRNAVAFREMRKKDYEKRRERREKRRMQFKLERELEELQEQEEAESEDLDEVDLEK